MKPDVSGRDRRDCRHRSIDAAYNAVRRGASAPCGRPLQLLAEKEKEKKPTDTDATEHKLGVGGVEKKNLKPRQAQRKT